MDDGQRADGAFCSDVLREGRALLEHLRAKHEPPSTAAPSAAK